MIRRWRAGSDVVPFGKATLDARLPCTRMIAVPSNFELSDAAMDSLVAAAAGNALALAMLSSQLLLQGKRQQAVTVARQARALAPDDAQVRALTAKPVNAGVPSWHFALVKDTARNRAYDAALRRACGTGARVLDIGAGTGLLAMMAARAGASEVITCEMNPPVADAAAEIIALNGFGGRVRVVGKKSTALDLEADLGGRVDVIVSEIVSNNLLGEGALPAVQDAVRRLLKPAGRVIPSRGQVRVALAYHRQPRAAWMDTVDGFDLSPFNRLAPTGRRVHVGDRHLRLRGEPATLLDVDFQSGGPYPDSQASVALVASGEPVNGLAQWIRLQLDAEGVYENPPRPGTTSCWAVMFQPFEREFEPAPGSTVMVHGAYGLTTLRIWAELPVERAGR